MKTQTLHLDDRSLNPEELSMPALMRELNLQEKPSWVLVKLMNALEKKRQGKGLGWSRAWNKYGMNVFRTHLLHQEEDQQYLKEADACLTHGLKDSPSIYQNFARELTCDPKCMYFTFYHNNTTEDGRQYEGLTISMGRKVTDDPSKRDRIDIILEDLREEGTVDGFVDRIRIYACPWSEYGKDRSHYKLDLQSPDGSVLKVFQPLYQRSIALYHQWKADEKRQWSHWSVRYIDYFGAREFIPKCSSFI